LLVAVAVAVAVEKSLCQIAENTMSRMSTPMLPQHWCYRMVAWLLRWWVLMMVFAMPPPELKPMSLESTVVIVSGVECCQL
jgi:hypothetical protein